MVADRARGVLSTADRQYLKATAEERQSDYTRQAQDQREEAIRVRTLNGLLDFSILLEHGGGEREDIFARTERAEFLDQLPDEGRRMRRAEKMPDPEPADQLLEALRDMFAYVYLGLHDRGEDIEAFTELVRQGVLKGERERTDKLSNVTVSIDVEEPVGDLEELAKRYIDGEDLTREERIALLEAAPALPRNRFFQETDEGAADEE